VPSVKAARAADCSSSSSSISSSSSSSSSTLGVYVHCNGNAVPRHRNHHNLFRVIRSVEEAGKHDDRGHGLELGHHVT
jgi:hypothetical protein